MKKTIYFAAMSLALGSMSASAAVDCVKLSVSVKHAVAADREKTLEIVSKQVGENSGCACEVVKAAIEGSQADPTLVAAIVEAAATAAPEQATLSAQCAIAVAPDAKAKVNAVIAKLGKAGSAGQASAMVSDGNNPLDFPAGSEGSGGSGSTAAGSGAPGSGGEGGAGGPVGPRPGDAPVGAGGPGGVGGAGGGAGGGPGGPGAGTGGSTPPPEVVPPVTTVNP